MKRMFLIFLLCIFSDNFSAVAPTRLVSPSTIDDKSITAAYLATYSLPLYIPKKMIINPQGNIKELLEKHALSFGTIGWRNTDWNKINCELMKRAEDPQFHNANNVISLDEAPKILRDAKAILKSFLPKDDKELASIIVNSQNYFVKQNFGRLLTYSELGRTIREKKLIHVHLPQKFLIIKDKERYLSIKESEKVIDEILRLFVHPDLTLQLGYSEWRYHFNIFAKKQERGHGAGLSKLAMRDLKMLCNESPFDIGYDNIFWDSKGDAIIIDTEYKGTHTKDCDKLHRYPVLSPNL